MTDFGAIGRLPSATSAPRASVILRGRQASSVPSPRATFTVYGRSASSTPAPRALFRVRGVPLPASTSATVRGVVRVFGRPAITIVPKRASFWHGAAGSGLATTDRVARPVKIKVSSGAAWVTAPRS